MALRDLIKSREFSVQKTIWTTLACLGAVIAVLCIQSYFNSKRSAEHLQAVYEHRVVPSATLNELAEPVRDVAFRLTAVLASQLPPASSNVKLKEARESVHKHWASYRAGTAPLSEEDAALAKNIDSGMKAFDSFCEDLSAAYAKNDTDALTKLFEDKLPVVQAELLNPILKLSRNQAAAIKAQYDESVAEANRFMLQTALAGACAAVFFVFGAIAVSSQLKRLNEKTSAVSESSERLRAVAVQLVDGSHRLTSASTEQASAVEESSASIQGVADSTRANSVVFRDAAEKAKQSEEAAFKGQSALENVSQAMLEINSGNELIKSSIAGGNQKLGEVIRLIEDIGQKTQVINEIVFQTRLLSFNASVEAARAGEHGRGFAVVAEEVGVLAHKSGIAAQEIRSILTTSTERVQLLVGELTSQIGDRAHEASLLVKKGLTATDGCQTVIKSVVDEIRETREVVERIAMASGEQVESIQSINSAIDSINSLTQGNLTVAQQSAQNGESVLGEADQLEALVGDMQRVLGRRDQSLQPVPQQLSAKSKNSNIVRSKAA